METLFFLKFWKPNASTATPLNPSVANENDVEEEEEEDSFFDLELSFDLIQTPQENIFESKPKSNTSDKTAGKPTLPLSTSDPISKRKILPIEPVSKSPQSPIALLKSAPKFGALMFKKPRQKTEKKTGEKAESEASMQSQKHKIKGVIAQQLAEEEAQNPPKLTRENSSRRSGIGIGLHNLRLEDPKTERFSKDVLQKYLNLIKPLYSKVSRRSTEKVKPSVDSPMASPVMPIFSMCSPKKDKQGNFPAGFRVVSKNLGKSKSATAMAAPPVQRRDDSLLLHNDGIQSAILHCKRSFNSRDSLSSLSRSTSDSSSTKSYSTDCSLLSRFASESQDKSARNSIEDGFGAEI